MRLFAALAFASLCAFSQDAVAVAISEGAPNNAAYEKVYGYSGTNLIYTCWALSYNPDRPSIRVSISAASNASPVSFTSAAHGFATSARPSITITGGTGNWAAVNGTFSATITGANTFTIPVDSTAFGAVTGTLVFTTTAPRQGVAEWSVRLYTYDGSNNLVWSGWLNGTNGPRQKCTDAALTTTNIQ